MKNIILPIIILATIFAGCTEIGPPISFSNGIYTDSVYRVSPVPASAPHQVLIEEFTGQSCTNCPAGHHDLYLLDSANPGRLNIIGYYVQGLSLTTPPNGAIYDFRTTIATTIGNFLYGGINTLPVAGIDRDPVGTVTTANLLQIDRGNWDNLVPTLLSVVDSVNLSVSSSYNTTTDSAKISVTITYTKNVTSYQNLSIAIVEDSMVDLQDEFPVNDPNYIFTDVLRDYVTYVPTGDAILPYQTPKTAGTALTRTYVHGISSTWIPAHCRVIAYILSTNAPYYTIWQSAQCKLVP